MFNLTKIKIHPFLVNHLMNNSTTNNAHVIGLELCNIFTLQVSDNLLPHFAFMQYS